MAEWTIQQLLNWITQYLGEKNVDSPRLSAELLLSSVLSLKRIELYTHFDTVVAQEQLDKLRELVKRAGEKEPVPYLVGKTEFYSLEIIVDSGCLIPRPETELLVEKAIEFLRSRSGEQSVCDLCTGSGCAAIAIAKNHPPADVIATDISEAALVVAAKNVEKHALSERVKLLSGDIFEPVERQYPGRLFDLITCNGPYITTAEFEGLDRNIKDYEPRQALVAGEDGLDIYRRVIAESPAFLKSGAALMLEIGAAQGKAVRDLLETTGCFADVRIIKDFQRLDRIAIAIRR